jgi:hypothetical protein
MLRETHDELKVILSLRVFGLGVSLTLDRTMADPLSDTAWIILLQRVYVHPTSLLASNGLLLPDPVR